jgi:predicted Zn finger-like uncharacterized protein
MGAVSPWGGPAAKLALDFALYNESHMSLITQCPACSTMFKVVPDQLRISEGWVRCGQCDEVFDANAHLRSLEATQVGPAQPQITESSTVEISTPAPHAEPMQGVPTEEAPANDDSESLLDAETAHAEPDLTTPHQFGLHSDAHEGDEQEWQATQLEASPTAPVDRFEEDVFLDHSPQDLPASEASQGSHYSPAAVDDWVYQSALAADQLPAADVPGIEEEQTPSFMPRSTQHTWSHRCLGRKVMLALFMVLALLLTSQWLFTERDRLAANIPALRPVLDSGCVVLGCTLSAPRQIESIAIDSSAFTQVKSGVYNLNLSLRNGAAVDLAAPALELTLTDMRDQALVRRVLLPGEYSAKILIPASSELVVSVPIAVRASAASEKISGYKLLAFYP